jgi:hypothetical protein
VVDGRGLWLGFGEVGAAGPASNTMMIMVTAPVSVATYAIIAGEVAITARRRPP